MGSVPSSGAICSASTSAALNLRSINLDIKPVSDPSLIKHAVQQFIEGRRERSSKVNTLTGYQFTRLSVLGGSTVQQLLMGCCTCAHS